MPQDFDGIPIVHPMVSRFFPFAADRAKDHVEHLWRIAAQAATNKIDQLDEGVFNRCVELKSVGIHKLTMALFWINPTDYLPADSKTRAYGHANGITAPPEDYRTYRTWMQQMAAKLGSDYPAQSHTAHLEARKKKKKVPPDPPEGPQFWLVAAGRQGGQWSDFLERGIISIGFDGTPDLRQYKDEEHIRQALQQMEETDSSKRNDVKACWEFVHDIAKNDIIFAKQGRTKVFGCGVVEGDYVFVPDRDTHKHVRKVKWLNTGEWELPEDRQMPQKTLTNITDKPDLVAAIADLVGLDLERPEEKTEPPQPQTGTAYWWLNANPKMWDLADQRVGDRQTYTSHNEKGNKRQKYKYFREVKTGDLVVGYVTSPRREVVAICKITQALHHNAEGEEEIEFEKIEQLDEPISYEDLQNNPDLTASEPIASHQGSLFKLTEEEYEVIRSLIDDKSLPPLPPPPQYTKAMAMAGLFLSEAQFDDMLSTLNEKKNIVLQGAPGVGKTFVAKRLAYALHRFTRRPEGRDDPISPVVFL